MSKLAVHIYINGDPLKACDFTTKQAREFKQAVLSYLKPISKNRYLELDIDSNEEYGIITCSNEHDKACDIPSDLTAVINKYIAIRNSEWSGSNLNITLAFI